MTMEGEADVTPKDKFFKNKMIIYIYMGLFSSCITGFSLYIPSIITNVISYHHPSYDKDQLDALGSTYKSFMDGTNAIVSLFMLPTCGSLSDVLGRKKVMLAGAITFICYVVTFKLADLYHSIWLLYGASVFSFYMINQIAALGFISEVSVDEKDKAKNFGLILAAFMVGVIFGAFGIGYLGKYGVDIPLYVIYGLMAFMIIFLVVAFHEDTPFYHKRHERKFSLRTSNPFVSLRRILALNYFVTTMVVVYSLNFIAISDATTSGILYTNYRYNWGSSQNGYNSAAAGLSTMIWQGIGVAVLLKLVSRETMLTITMYFAGLVHITQGYAPFGWLYTTAAVSGSFSAIGFPLMQSLFSERIPKEHQGSAFGGLSSVSSIATFFGALFSENIFSWCIHHGSDYKIICPGTAYYICGFLFFIDGTICLLLFMKSKAEQRANESTIKYYNINVKSINGDETESLLRSA